MNVYLRYDVPDQTNIFHSRAVQCDIKRTSVQIVNLCLSKREIRWQINRVKANIENISLAYTQCYCYVITDFVNDLYAVIKSLLSRSFSFIGTHVSNNKSGALHLSQKSPIQITHTKPIFTAIMSTLALLQMFALRPFIVFFIFSAFRSRTRVCMKYPSYEELIGFFLLCSSNMSVHDFYVFLLRTKALQPPFITS